MYNKPTPPRPGTVKRQQVTQIVPPGASALQTIPAGGPPAPIPNNSGLNSNALATRRAGVLFLAHRNTWRWQAAALCWLLLAVSIAGLLASTYIVNDRLQNFQQIEQIAVPSINAANQAEQSLSAEVAANASYILSDQATRQSLLAQIERNRAEFERALQTGYSSLSTLRTTSPSVDTAFDYLNQYNQSLQDAFSQARSLANAGNQNDAVKAYLSGQDSYYKPSIFTIYYLRSIYINQLDQAKEAALGGDTPQLIAAAVLAIGSAVLLLFISLWLTFKVKRVLVPLVNLGFILAAVYSAFLIVSLVSSGNDLDKVVTSYNQASLLSDSQRLLTDAASDQLQWLIGGATDTNGQFKGDEVYAVDFKTQTSRLLAVSSNQANQVCPTTPSDRSKYALDGAMGDVCRNLLANNQVTTWNRFYNSYLAWLNDDAKFRQLATGSKVSDALTYLNNNASKNFSQLGASLTQLRTDNEQIYNSSSRNASDQLGWASILSFVIYPVVLVLGAVGLLWWRREF